MHLDKAAKSIYKNKYTATNQDVPLANRCMDFKYMEQLAQKYMEDSNKQQSSN